MVRAILVALLALAACSGPARNEAADAPVPANAAAPARIADAANILDSAAEARLAERSEALERATGHQLVVVTVASLEGQPIEAFTIALARRWGIGRRGHDDGVVVLVAPNERHVRIEVGLGLEATLTNAICAQIIDERMIPRFRENDFAGGIEAGVAELIRLMLDGRAPPR